MPMGASNPMLCSIHVLRSAPAGCGVGPGVGVGAGAGTGTAGSDWTSATGRVDVMRGVHLAPVQQREIFLRYKLLKVQ